MDDNHSPGKWDNAPDFGPDICFVRQGHLFRLRAAAILLKDNHVLMVKNERTSYYYSVGGAVELEETTEDAVRREVREECGLSLDILRLAVIHQNFFTDSEIGGDRWHELAFYYVMDYRGQPLAPAASHSMLGSPETLHWLPLEGFGQYNAYPGFFAELKSILLSPEPVRIVTRE